MERWERPWWQGEEGRLDRPQSAYVVYETDQWVGLDIGAKKIHAVTLARGPESRLLFVDADVFAPTDVERIRLFIARAVSVVIDAPAQLSTAPHEDEVGWPDKFRLARCAEVNLWLAGLAPPFVAPQVGQPVPPWMQVGLDMHRLVAGDGIQAIETYPTGAFKWLAPGSLAPKATPRGIRERAEAVAMFVAMPVEALLTWSIDALDAAIAAVAAHHLALGIAAEFGCGHDESRIVLPGR